MSRFLRFGRAKQPSDSQQADGFCTGSTAPMVTGAVTLGSDNDLTPSDFAGLLRPDPSDSPRTIGAGGLRILPSSPLTKDIPQEVPEFADTGTHSSSSFNEGLKPKAIELPRTLEIGGFLYQRVDTNLTGELTMTSNDQPSSATTPLLHQHQGHLPKLDEQVNSRGCSSSAVRLDHQFERREGQRVDHGSRQPSIHEQNLSEVRQEPASNLAVTQDEVTENHHDSQTSSARGAISYETTSNGLQLTNAHFVRPAVRKPKRKSNMLRKLEPHNVSPEPESESEVETLRPTTANTSQQAALGSKRRSTMLRELEGFNKSPGSDSDSEQESLQLRTARSLHSASPGSRRKSVLLRELEAHNQSPEPESELDIGKVCDLKDDWSDMPLTRSARKNMVNLFNGKPPAARKDLNVDKLMLAELSGMDKRTETFNAEDSSTPRFSSHQGQQEPEKEVDLLGEGENEEEHLPKKIKTTGRSHSQPTPAHRKMPRQVVDTVGNGQRNKESAAELAWLIRDNHKERIGELLKSRGYNPHPSQQEMGAEGRKKPAYHITAEVAEGFQGAFHVKEGLYVFTPMAAAFVDFGRFLKDVEEIAGRKMGVVKIIVPECLLRTSRPSRSRLPRSPVIQTMEVNMSLNKDAAEKPSRIFDMLAISKPTSLGADEWLNMIRQDKARLVKKPAIGEEATSRNGVWKESHMLKPYTERRMIQRSKQQDGAVLCALNEPATPLLRAALECKDPNMENFFGNRFASSRSTQPGINESVIHIAGGRGPLFPLQMNKYAAYSLNYHHSGAPTIWTITLPEHHAKLEEVMHITQDSENLSGRPPEPPTCSQFVAHQPMYVPRETLSFHDIGYTEVVQHEGEMVIIFPYAYHQAYVAGPNITEEILYASDRCKIFHRENLYQHCNHNCAAGQPDDFNLTGVFSNVLSSIRNSHHHRSGLESPSASLSPRQSRQTSTILEHHSKHISALKAKNHIPNNNNSISQSAQASRPQPSTNHMATRMTSNPHEPDLWETEHAFGDSHDPADSDDGTPIGGIRPRDPITGRLLTPIEWRTSRRKRGDEPEDAPSKHSRHH